MPESTTLSDHAGPTQWTEDPIAIIGMGLRLPGSIRTPQQFWEFLTNKGSGRCRVPPSRYNVDAFLGPKGKPGLVCTEYGYFLEDDLASADDSFWTIPPKELEVLDPQQRLMLEVIYECLESSGTTDYRGKDIGVYVGALGEDWMDIQTRDPLHPGSQYVTGYSDFAISNRVSKKLGLTGPSMTIRTACSSSLMALHTACQSLYVGECSSAVVGGCNLILTPRMTATMSELGVLSPNGTSRSFDAQADGYARGEAVNAIHIKRLSHALRDGDPIRSVIRSVCINSDGPRSPLYIPSPISHELLIRRSYDLAGIRDPSQTAMIECHGTGTMVGDMQEGRAVANVFGKLGGVLIGSVKPNIGHSEGASGLSSIIKMVLALENQTIPPNINFKRPNPKIPFEKAKLRVPVDCEPWPRDKAERVGLNGFGIGGANGHVLLESARSFNGATVNEVRVDDCPKLLVFSGTHPESVKQNITESLEHLSENPGQVADASYTLGCRRQTYSHRAFAISSGETWNVSQVQKAGPAPELVWVFSGQGVQYACMGQELVDQHPVAKNTVQHLDEILDSIDPDRSWTVQEELSRPESTSRLSQAQYSQPCCTALQIALVDVLRSSIVQPSAVVGHSAGEIAAAYAAGALTAAEAMTISYHRGQVVSRLEGSGGMMAVGLSQEQVSPFLTENVTVACENSPRNVTLSGDSDALDGAAEMLRECYSDAFVKRLAVNCAYHSAYMEKIAAEYSKILAAIDVPERQLSCSFISSVTGEKVLNSVDLGREYWCRNLRSPVLFHKSIQKVTGTLKNPLFLEVGAHPALLGPLRDTAPSSPHIPTLIRGENGYTATLRTAGRLFQIMDIDLSTLCRGKTLGSLPPYKWHHDGPFWSESRVSRNWRFRRHSHHELLGSQIPDGNDMEPLWRSVIYLENIPWLRDHVMDGKVILPRAYYIAMAGEAIRQLTGQGEYSLRRVAFLAEPTLHDNQPVELLTQFRPAQDPEWYDFTVTGHFEGNWTKLCTAQARDGRLFHSEITRLRPGPRKVKEDVFYHVMKRIGVEFGSRFRALENISTSVTASQATGDISSPGEEDERKVSLHPSTICSIFQLFTVAEKRGRGLDRLAVPMYIDEVYVCPSSGAISAQSAITSKDGRILSANTAGFCGEDLVFAVANAQLSFERYTDRGPDPHAGARLVWKPDIEEADMTRLIRSNGEISSFLQVVEELALACTVEVTHQIQTLSAASLPHYINYHQWLNMQRQLAERGEYANVTPSQTIVSMESSERKEYIDNLYQRVVETPGWHIATAVRRVYQNTRKFFDGQVDPLSLLMEDDLLSEVYAFKVCDFADFFRVFGHNRPCARILEIGAGTGGTTATVLPAMHGLNGERLYESYTYTDVSAGFLDGASERFKMHGGIDYRVLDIAGDIAAQGFNEPYDLIIAANVLHATPNLQDTLKNVKALLKPDGKLFLQELAPATKWINYIMGALPGWWLSTDSRLWEPYVSPERWDHELRAAGLSGADAVVHDGQMNAHIISSMPKACLESGKNVTILCGRGSEHLENYLLQFQSSGFATSIRHLGDGLPTNHLIISLLELDAPLLHSPTPERYRQLRDMITTLDERPMLWVTRPSQVACTDPRYAATLGLLRTTRRELGLTVATLELDSVDDKGISAAIVVAERLLCPELDSAFDPVLEYAYVGGTLMVGRFYPVIVGDDLLDQGPLYEGTTAPLVQADTSGGTDKVSWRKRIHPAPTHGDDWVEVQTRAIGIDSKNVSSASDGWLDGILGTECSGTVMSVGRGVKTLSVGDRVMVLSLGSERLASRFVTSDKLCVRMARNLSWIEAATFPYAFAPLFMRFSMSLG